MVHTDRAGLADGKAGKPGRPPLACLEIQRSGISIGGIEVGFLYEEIANHPR